MVFVPKKGNDWYEYQSFFNKEIKKFSEIRFKFK
jgi:hypothetical protein